MTNWQEAKSDLGKIVRWNEVANDQIQEEKTIYVGNIVEGVLATKRSGVGSNNSWMYEIETMDKGLLSIWGSKLLDDKFKDIPEGYLVKVNCLGLQQSKTGGNDYIGYKVEYAPAPMKEATGSVADGSVAETFLPGEGDVETSDSTIEEIKSLAKGLFDLSDLEQIKIKVMEVTGIAFIQPNYDDIVKQLKTLQQ